MISRINYLDTVKDLLVHSPTSQWTNASCICAKKPSTRSIALFICFDIQSQLGERNRVKCAI
jgi:hypothetical protein